MSRLLVRLYPDAEVIDGRGGDGGRDVQIRRDGQLVIFDLKSFHDRIGKKSPNRRRQVERSLAEGAKLNPDEWYLIALVNPNPDELAWFDDLKTYRHCQQERMSGRG